MVLERVIAIQKIETVSFETWRWNQEKHSIKRIQLGFSKSSCIGLTFLPKTSREVDKMSLHALDSHCSTDVPPDVSLYMWRRIPWTRVCKFQYFGISSAYCTKGWLSWRNISFWFVNRLWRLLEKPNTKSFVKMDPCKRFIIKQTECFPQPSSFINGMLLVVYFELYFYFFVALSF